MVNTNCLHYTLRTCALRQFVAQSSKSSRRKHHHSDSKLLPVEDKNNAPPRDGQSVVMSFTITLVLSVRGCDSLPSRGPREFFAEHKLHTDSASGRRLAHDGKRTLGQQPHIHEEASTVLVAYVTAKVELLPGGVERLRWQDLPLHPRTFHIVPSAIVIRDGENVPNDLRTARNHFIPHSTLGSLRHRACGFNTCLRYQATYTAGA